ncbi:MAG: flagellar hook protein FlgE [Armatimonadota bacterium]
MISSLYSGVSGLRSHQTELDVTGNNLANINTSGFKATKVSFSDILSRTIDYGRPPSGSRGGVNPKQIGSGVQVAALKVDYSQGTIQNTGRDADVAIDGTGFFILSDGNKQFLTRDGSFALDSEGYLVSSSTGLRVVGWQTEGTPGTGSPPSSGIKIPIGSELMAKATSKVRLSGNLSAASTPGVKTSSRFRVYDSLGTGRDMEITFTRQEGGAWTWEAREPGADAPAGSGTIEFGPNGKPISGASGTIQLSPPTASGAAQQTVELDLSMLTQLAADTDVALESQDGLPPAPMLSFKVDGDGTIIGLFGNGLSRAVGKLAVGYVPNPSGLRSVGQNMWAVAPNSGPLQMRDASAVGSRLIGGALEASNVDMAEEFTRMIIAQRAFQASARIITTSDEVLQELMQIKR